MKKHLPIVLLLHACSANTASTEAAVAPPVTPNEVAAESGLAESPADLEPATMATSATSAPSPAARAARVEAARMRLNSSAPGKLVWESIEAAGGLQRWFGSADLSFRFRYAPKKRGATDTRQTIDVWSSRARHTVEGTKTEFGWDGEKAWVNPPDAELTTNARFWALTPYYFVGIPFVLADPGVTLQSLPAKSWEGVEYDLVKASFLPGTGDASGDYYVLYIDRSTKRVRALRYVVSYPGFRPDGGHGPEKLMTYEGDIEASGMVFAAKHRTFKLGAQTGEYDEHVTDVAVSDLAFSAETPQQHFAPPEGARLITGWK